MTRDERIFAQAKDWVTHAGKIFGEQFGPGTAEAMWADPETREKIIEMAATVAWGIEEGIC